MLSDVRNSTSRLPIYLAVFLSLTQNQSGLKVIILENSNNMQNSERVILVLTSKLLARRWRVCNSSSPEQFAKTSNEEAWRERTLEFLSNAHTIGGISELSFETVTSDYSVSSSSLITPASLELKYS
jgi:hypothetical protein